MTKEMKRIRRDTIAECRKLVELEDIEDQFSGHWRLGFNQCKVNILRRLDSLDFKKASNANSQ